ncbi:MAG: CBS domain-containing protein [Gammaproteobacteria bacterium]|nr:CBS domain-containing protein [Gammaproteobacteria bacterium]MCW8840362.1 CBS domain-containing protein [Gammaproteobacteria bacterium]MCW8927309.1 CBS domain-containing protein [Gammaproteobacteria bacterium]MCW8972767.1 CBS domain-containing protein [Gammaproteobacteria bacterium]MCW8993011.1 CBS domain-containing protein [Gammaproteobacteria bacterium]
MSENYTSLPYHHLNSGITYHRPPQRLPEQVTADSPATDVMTDFTKVSAITMGPCATIEAAEQRMIASSVRLLLVTDQANAILGIITSTDLQGDRPVKYLQEVGGKREDIYLRDIMTPADRIEVLYMVDVENARVGHIVETLKRVGRQHALVIDLDDDRQQVVRGLFSTKQISKQLGINIDPTEVAKTFAELEAALTA